MQYQDLNIAKNRATKMYMKNSNRSISATFRTLRKKAYTSFFGDYPILSTIINIIINLAINPSRFQVRHALNQSEELNSLSRKEKIALLDQLIDPMYVQLKAVKKSRRARKN